TTFTDESTFPPKYCRCGVLACGAGAAWSRQGSLWTAVPYSMSAVSSSPSRSPPQAARNSARGTTRTILLMTTSIRGKAGRLAATLLLSLLDGHRPATRCERVCGCAWRDASYPLDDREALMVIYS